LDASTFWLEVAPGHPDRAQRRLLIGAFEKDQRAAAFFMLGTLFFVPQATRAVRRASADFLAFVSQSSSSVKADDPASKL
jgi:hypothetical protein